MNNKLYTMYLQSAEWRSIAEECKRLADYKCFNCGSVNNLHAHHLTYDRVGEELQSDLICLCSTCHEKAHNMSSGTLSKTKRLRGGFRMVYKSYDDALVTIVKSTKDLELLILIRDMFTYKQVEVNLSTTDLHAKTGIAKSKITEVVSRMVSADLLRKIRRGVYRLNPYMYVPFRADAETLQAEWLTLT